MSQGSFIVFRADVERPLYLDTFSSMQEAKDMVITQKYTCAVLCLDKVPAEISKTCFDFVIKSMAELDKQWIKNIEDI
tara:strand:- start:46 stop:279 length:234 start_codon:yes stop_codon:yes gene_type:complete